MKPTSITQGDSYCLFCSCIKVNEIKYELDDSHTIKIHVCKIHQKIWLKETKHLICTNIKQFVQILRQLTWSELDPCSWDPPNPILPLSDEIKQFLNEQ